MRSKEFQPAMLLAVAGTLAIGGLAILWSARAAAITAGLGLLALAWARLARPEPQALAARSRTFDTFFLAVLGAGVIFLAATADNIS